MYETLIDVAMSQAPCSACKLLVIKYAQISVRVSVHEHAHTALRIDLKKTLFHEKESWYIYECVMSHM